jgi:hypothetical protein
MSAIAIVIGTPCPGEPRNSLYAPRVRALKWCFIDPFFTAVASPSGWRLDDSDEIDDTGIIIFRAHISSPLNKEINPAEQMRLACDPLVRGGKTSSLTTIAYHLVVRGQIVVEG